MLLARPPPPPMLCTKMPGESSARVVMLPRLRSVMAPLLRLPLLKLLALIPLVQVLFHLESSEARKT